MLCRKSPLPLIRWVVVPLFAISLLACGGGSGAGEGQEASDTLTRRQKDSIVSTLPVPGAGAVGKALRAVDSANARAQRHDTMGHDGS
jgi:hypothetical protein